MIQIDRNRLDEYSNPIRPNQKWFENAQTATDKALQEKNNHIPQQNIYQSLEVKVSLEKLFEYKCAYCENFLEESGWNVEHYRPKGRVFERIDHPGYYWLTYDWNNFFPSCVPCNQKRKDLPIWDDKTLGETAGKADHFPVVNEENRAMKPEDDLEKEEPLLINPCEEDPENFLTYDVLGNILASKNENKAENTIKYYNLKRKRLVRKRKIIIEAAIDFVKTIEQYKKNNNPLFIEFERLFEKQCLSQTSIFSACARSVKKFPSNFGIDTN